MFSRCLLIILGHVLYSYRIYVYQKAMFAVLLYVKSVQVIFVRMFYISKNVYLLEVYITRLPVTWNIISYIYVYYEVVKLYLYLKTFDVTFIRMFHTV